MPQSSAPTCQTSKSNNLLLSKSVRTLSLRKVLLPLEHRYPLSSFAVRNPQEAALDSKVLLQNAEMGAAMARAMKHDAGAFDVDDYLAKMLVFLGGANEEVADDEFDERGEDASLNWERIGAKVFKHSRRAVCMDFM